MLSEGDLVSFDIVEGEKGLRAENVVNKAAGSPTPSSKAEPAAEEAQAAPEEAAAEEDSSQDEEKAAESA